MWHEWGIGPCRNALVNTDGICIRFENDWTSREWQQSSFGLDYLTVYHHIFVQFMSWHCFINTEWLNENYPPRFSLFSELKVKMLKQIEWTSEKVHLRHIFQPVSKELSKFWNLNRKNERVRHNVEGQVIHFRLLRCSFHVWSNNSIQFYFQSFQRKWSLKCQFSILS